MNQLFAASAGLVLALTLWVLGKKPKILYKTRVLEEFSISETSLVSQLPLKERLEQPLIDLEVTQLGPPTPINSRESVYLKKVLKKLILSGPDERLLAVEIAAKWGDSHVIPILKLGLRDMDSRVVVKAAEAISQFRSHSSTVKNRNPMHYPRNVFLMR